jgi:hypothetical protein
MVGFWHTVSISTVTNQVMRTVSRQTTGLIATLIVAGVLGLLLLLNVTSGHQQRCGIVAADNFSTIKLI